jgi:hypothetical protein
MQSLGLLRGGKRIGEEGRGVMMIVVAWWGWRCRIFDDGVML